MNFYQELADLAAEFPINRRHQRLATVDRGWIFAGDVVRFQSIGVTNDWRPEKMTHFNGTRGAEFPINRRHQRLAT